MFIGIIFAIYVFAVKKEKVDKKYDGTKLLGGICEAIGQVFYMMVIVAEYVPGYVIISAYCAVSTVWGRIFLKEKLSWKHYLALAAAFAGILILGFFDV
jgi:drug/metabolite transporter (DMT)-like permease